jgi:hypothetical protein
VAALRPRVRANWAALLLLAGCAHAPGRGQDGALKWRYQVEVPAELDRLRVSLCFPEQVPRRLVIDERDESAIAAVEQLTVDGGTATIDRAGGAITLDGVEPGACVRYAVALDTLLEGDGTRVRSAAGDVVSVDPRLWLWRPASLYFEAQVELGLKLAEGVQASVPWEPRGEGEYQLPITALMWASSTVFGPLVRQRVEAAGATFEVAIVDNPRKLSAEGLERWISTAAQTVASLYGEFPTERMQVIVLPIPGGAGPVYFGMALRGGGPAVSLLVASEAEDHEFPGEWVAIHEFLHHGMPFVRPEDAWLSEGFVTYYTEVLPTRRGFRSEKAGWQALSEGFARGRRDGTGQGLQDEARDMHETRSYQRVYWGGAAIALLADVGLRERERSLDGAMQHLRRCCARQPRVWPAPDVLRELDAWAAGPVFVALAGAWLRATEFPDLQEVYRKLGVDVIKGDVTLHEAAPAADVRRAIFARPR